MLLHYATLYLTMFYSHEPYTIPNQLTDRRTQHTHQKPDESMPVDLQPSPKKAHLGQGDCLCVSQLILATQTWNSTLNSLTPSLARRPSTCRLAVAVHGV